MVRHERVGSALALFAILSAAVGSGQISDRAKRAEEAMKSLGYEPKVETTPLGDRLQYRSPGKLAAGGAGLSLTVFLTPTEKQAREVMDAVCSLYISPTYGPADKIDIGLPEKASVFKSLGGWLPDPPYWVSYGHVGGHALCGSVYAAVTQEGADSAPQKDQADAKASGRRIAAKIQPEAVALLKKLTKALIDAGVCR